jgi:hypothetical protein
VGRLGASGRLRGDSCGGDACGAGWVCAEWSLEVVSVGRSVAGHEDKEASGPVVSKTLGAIEPDIRRVTRLQSAVHQLHELRDSGTLTCHDEGGGEQLGIERRERASRTRPNFRASAYGGHCKPVALSYRAPRSA